MREVKVSDCINRQQDSPRPHRDPQLSAAHLAYSSGLILILNHSHGSDADSEPPYPGSGLLHPLDPRYQGGRSLSWEKGAGEM